MTWTILQADARQIPLADKSVQCVVTSPPYWGLRDYGTATWVGGDEGCDHVRISGGPRGAKLEGGDQRGRSEYPYRLACNKCGATRIDSQIGLEKTPEEYVAKIVAVFAEVWRVLRDDGVCFVNLGDSYAGGKQGRDDGGYNGNGSFHGQPRHDETKPIQRKPPTGLKPKDLVGIPWRIAFALQAAGWYLRSDIIWSKPNPMPESVTDRPTKAHEYIFLLSKKPNYYFDQDAVREPHIDFERGAYGQRVGSGADERPEPGVRTGTMRNIDRNGAQREYNPAGRNIRTVWDIATQPFPSAHFATFPEEIAIRCIKAGSKVGDTILDPFSGAGTVPLVADKLNRRGIGLELKADYCRMASRRCYDDAPLLSSANIIV